MAKTIARHGRALRSILSAALLGLQLAVTGAFAASADQFTVPQLIAAAEEYALSGNYDEALPLYERAIASLAEDPLQQNQLRYRYGIILNALGGQRPDLYPLARGQFEAVLRYVESGPGIPFEHSAARVRSAIAHTYHQYSAVQENPNRRAVMLRNAYQLYSSAIKDLRAEGDWQNLAITAFNIGQVCEWQGNLEEAIEWLEQAVALDRQYGFADLEEDQAYLTALRELVNPQQPVGNTAI
ncbi:tetratricopeptide repeat protein [Microbulbifer agarilyticus]|uniref:tetratricopeptide repeat protein n=1 Tax=Microbulbifer agarilyticus TaxID=260552 RepID=UPI001CD21CB9|nr:tetratricopeptide repeat protein [Microbulbifer agarilyticus]MCA0901626.1 tetratricopeptide repeat protein [Microbulbifer agarilyticus]